MTDKKISDLANASALDGSELVELVQGGANVKKTSLDIAKLVGNLSGTNIYLGAGSGANVSTPGNNNIVFGKNSISSSTVPGDKNIVVGNNSLGNVDTNGYNVVIGNDSMQQCTDGYSNTIVGNGSAYNLVHGHDNVVFGGNSAPLMTGSSNCIIGCSNASNMSTGQANTMLGINVGTTLTTGSGNILIGDGSDVSSPGANNELHVGNFIRVTNANNDSFGTDALSQITSGGSNVAFGSLSLAGCTSGSANTAVGHQALNGCNGDNNTMVGFQAFRDAAAGNNNSGLGWRALENINGGNDNTGIGWQVGQNLTSGSNNIMIGSNAGSAIVSGSHCIIVGAAGATPNDDYQFNIGDILVGRLDTKLLQLQGELNAEGNKITAVPDPVDPQDVATKNYVDSALPTLDTLFYGGFLGIDTDVNLAANSNDYAPSEAAVVAYVAAHSGATSIDGLSDAIYDGSGNLAVGANSLTALGGGANNLALGQNAGSSVVTGNNNILIGHDTDVPIDGDNYLNIGGCITGDMTSHLDVDVTLQTVNLAQYDRAIANIVPGVSPYVYINGNPWTDDVVVTGGVVSLMEFSRDNGATYIPVGIVTGIVTLSPSDRLRVTYSVTPTMTKIPR